MVKFAYALESQEQQTRLKAGQKGKSSGDETLDRVGKRNCTNLGLREQLEQLSKLGLAFDVLRRRVIFRFGGPAIGKFKEASGVLGNARRAGELGRRQPRHLRDIR